MHDDTNRPDLPGAAGAADGTPAPDATAGGEAAPDLATQLEAARAESAQTKDALLRALADAENIRRRAVADVASAHKYAIEGFANNLLGVKDTLEMAVNDKKSTTEQLRMGVELTLKNLSTAFEKAKISEVEAIMTRFLNSQEASRMLSMPRTLSRIVTTGLSMMYLTPTGAAKW